MKLVLSLTEAHKLILRALNLHEAPIMIEIVDGAPELSTDEKLKQATLCRQIVVTMRDLDVGGNDKIRAVKLLREMLPVGVMCAKNFMESWGRAYDYMDKYKLLPVRNGQFDLTPPSQK